MHPIRRPLVPAIAVGILVLIEIRFKKNTFLTYNFSAHYRQIEETIKAGNIMLVDGRNESDFHFQYHDYIDRFPLPGEVGSSKPTMSGKREENPKENETAINHLRSSEAMEVVQATKPAQVLRKFTTSLSVWEALASYKPIGNTSNLSQESICKHGPGKGNEGSGGYKILTKAVQIAPPQSKSSCRLMCAMYTHSDKRELSRAAALTYGRQCDGFMAFSTEEIPELGHVNITHKGPESYGNMWQKVRSIWEYLYTHYANDYDYFHLGGDDMYVIVPNLRYLLAREAGKHEFFFSGAFTRNVGKKYIHGGPGYTMSSATLKKFMKDIFPRCRVNMEVAFEDRAISLCLAENGIMPMDSRDPVTLRQRYHMFHPDKVYSFDEREKRHPNHEYYESLSPQSNHSKTRLGAAAKFSVAFHHVRSPEAFARIHAVLHRLCPNLRDRADQRSFNATLATENFNK